MNIDDILIRRSLVLASALVYWGGVWVQARRVRRHIGKSPNIKPHGLKERLLWMGWLLVVVGWITLPFATQTETRFVLVQLQASFVNPIGLVLGVLLIVAGYAGTLWCYACMGDLWRIGINREEKNTLVTRGPYARVRHPIYVFQMLMLAGAVALLPSLLPLVILAIHLVCVLIKALDEEAYLTRLHGADYQAYVSRTGRLLPPLSSRNREN